MKDSITPLSNDAKEKIKLEYENIKEKRPDLVNHVSFYQNFYSVCESLIELYGLENFSVTFFKNYVFVLGKGKVLQERELLNYGSSKVSFELLDNGNLIIDSSRGILYDTEDLLKHKMEVRTEGAKSSLRIFYNVSIYSKEGLQISIGEYEDGIEYAEEVEYSKNSIDVKLLSTFKPNYKDDYFNKRAGVNPKWHVYSRNRSKIDTITIVKYQDSKICYGSCKNSGDKMINVSSAW